MLCLLSITSTISLSHFSLTPLLYLLFPSFFLCAFALIIHHLCHHLCFLSITFSLFPPHHFPKCIFCFFVLFFRIPPQSHMSHHHACGAVYFFQAVISDTANTLNTFLSSRNTYTYTFILLFSFLYCICMYCKRHT